MQMSNAAILMDRLGRVRWVNPEFEKKSGYRFEDLKGKDPFQLLRCDELCPKNVTRIRVALSNLERYKGEVLFQDKSSMQRVWEIEIRPIIEANGKHTGFLAFETDVSTSRSVPQLNEISSSFLGGALDAIPMQIVILDAKGTVLFVNEQSRRFARENQLIDLEFVIGRNYASTITGASGHVNSIQSEIASGIQSIFNRQRNIFHLEYPCESTSDPCWFLLTASCFESSGEVLVVVSQQDITDRKRAELKLLSKGRKLRNIYESSSDAILLLQNNRIIECNAKAVQMFSAPSQDALLSLHPASLSPPFQPDGMDSHSKAERYMAEVVQFGEARFDWEHRRADGRIFPAEVLLTRFEYEGQQILQANVRDITDRKLAEEQMQSLNKQLTEDLAARVKAEKSLRELADYLDVYRKIVDNHAIVAETDTSGTIVSVNDAFCRISGYSRGELLGKNHRILNSGVHPKSMWKEMYKTVANRGFWHGEICNRAKNGSMYWVNTTIAPLFDEAGKIRGYFAIRADITKLKEAQAQAESASRSKSEFLANMSHEIRTPMTAILGYADILAESQENGISVEESMDCINTIKRNGEHLLSIINDILDISKIEADKMTAERIEVSIVQVVQDVIELMKVKAQAKRLSLDATFCTNVPELIQTDPTRLRQILVNLIGNAIKFTEIGGVNVVVRLDLNQPEMIFFDVIDTGIGLTDENIAKLFQPFEQLDTSMTRKYGGTGLGLRISKRLAQILGGDISVCCAIGGGCMFSVSVETGCVTCSTTATGMPMKPLLSPASNADPVAATPSLQGVKILFAEDGPDNQRLLSFHLRKAGAEVEIVENGKQAVERLCHEGSLDQPLLSPPAFDLILMDMQMPEIDGYEATKILREKGLRLPVLALTAHAMDADLDKCLAAGCNTRLTKPIDKSALLRACRDWAQHGNSIASVSESTESD
jgi:PAS domain S-box-containing protein